MLIPTGYAQINWFFTGPATPNGAQITMGADWQGTANPDVAASEAFDAIIPLINNLEFADSLQCTRCEVKFGPNSTGAVGIDTGLVAGTSNGDALSPNSAVLVTKNTGMGGRQGKGRFYIPGLLETSPIDGGLLIPSTVASLQSAVDQFYSALVAANFLPSLLRSPDSPISAPAPITSFSVQSQLATQRRRLRR